MARSAPVLVMTRPEPDSLSFLNELCDRLEHDVSFVVSPVLEIQPMKMDVDLSVYRTLVLTSRNAVSCLGSVLMDRNVATVGKRTAEMASSLSAFATCLGETVEEFLENRSRVEAPAIHLRGVHSRGCLAETATEQGTAIDEAIIYDQVARPLSAEALRALADGHAVVPVFSPRSAKLISAHPCAATTQVLAISPATANAWAGDGEVAVAARPDRAAMLDLVARAF